MGPKISDLLPIHQVVGVYNNNKTGGWTNEQIKNFKNNVKWGQMN